MDDAYTASLRLCDYAGMVSHDPILEETAAPTCDRSYLDRLNRLRRMTHASGGERVDDVTEPFACTGSAHLAGEHFRCTSPAHHGTTVLEGAAAARAAEILTRRGLAVTASSTTGEV